MFQSILKWIIKEVGTAEVEQEIIPFVVGEITSNTKLTPAQIRSILIQIKTVVEDAIEALPK